MEDFHKEFQPEIVDEQIDTYDGHVAHELLSSAQTGGGKRNVFLQQETRKQRYGEGNQQGCYMRSEGGETQLDEPSPENKIVGYEIEHPVETDIGCTAYAVAEKFPAEIPAERGMEKIDGLADNCPCRCEELFHLNSRV